MSTLDDYRRRFQKRQDGQNIPMPEPGGKPGRRIDGGPIGLDGSWAGDQAGGGQQYIGGSQGWNPGGPWDPGFGPGAQWGATSGTGGMTLPGPQPGGQMGYPQQQGMGPASIYDVFNSAVPLMNANRDKQIGQSMATAGMSGTRFGTAAQNNVARIGADTALQQDQLLTNLMYQQGQADADRSLQASGQAMNLAQIYDQMQRSRIDQLSQVGMWEQTRGDAFNMLPYQDFMASRLGYLPQVMQGVTGQGAMPQAQNPISTTTPGSPGFADYAMLAAAIYGMAGSDKRLKRDIVRHDREAIPGVPYATWKWRWNDKEAFGVIADDLEKVRPDLVVEIGGIKHVRYRELMEVA